MRRFTRIVGVVVSLLALLIVLLEVGLQACPPQLWPKDVQQWLAARLSIGHPTLGALERPHTAGLFMGGDVRVPYRTDGEGFYNTRWPWPDTADIVVVGDDMTVGHGVDTAHAWPALVAQTIGPHRLLNLALRDAGPVQYARAYALFGVPRQPQVLLVAFSCTDDWQDAVRFERWQRLGIGGNYRVWHTSGSIAGGWRHPLGAVHAWLAHQSLLYQLVRVSLRHDRRPSTPIWLFGGAYLQIQPERLEARRTLAQPGQQAFTFVLEAMTYMQVIARASGTQVVVVLLPSKEDIYALPPAPTPGDPGHALQEALTQRGIATLDLTPALRQASLKAEVLFFPVSPYLNAQGHAMVAHEILRYLTTVGPTSALRPWSAEPLTMPRTSLQSPAVSHANQP